MYKIITIMLALQLLGSNFAFADTIDAKVKDRWSYYGWQMGFVKACNTSYTKWKETKDRISNLRDSGKIMERHYTIFIRQIGRTALGNPQGCSKSKNDKFLENVNEYLDGL